MDYSFFPTYYSIVLFLKVLPIIIFILPIILSLYLLFSLKYNIRSNDYTELYYPRTDRGWPRAAGAPANGLC